MNGIEKHKEKKGRANINFYNCDNVEFMKTKPDKYYKLAIVDPPSSLWTFDKVCCVPLAWLDVSF